jgi:hypothetical protein
MVIKDLKTRAPEGYYENTVIRGVEMDMVEELDCLVQAFIGELKTNKGDVVGTGQENYGSDLPRIIGDETSLSLEIEVENLIQNKASEYPEILICTPKIEINTDKAMVIIQIELNTIYGITLETIEITGRC